MVQILSDPVGSSANFQQEVNVFRVGCPSSVNEMPEMFGRGNGVRMRVMKMSIHNHASGEYVRVHYHSRINNMTAQLQTTLELLPNE